MTRRYAVLWGFTDAVRADEPKSGSHEKWVADECICRSAGSCVGRRR